MVQKKGGRRGRKSHRGNKGGAWANKSRKTGISFSDKVDDDIQNFASHTNLSSDFIALREHRNKAPIKLNKKLRLSKLQQINDMVDLNRGNFNNIEEMSINSMMYQLPNKKNYKNKNSMLNEVKYTNMHREEIINKSYRKLTIEFVKAKEVYDPSKDLIEMLKNKKNVVVTQIKGKPNIIDIAEELIKENETEQKIEEELELENLKSDNECTSSSNSMSDNNLQHTIDEAVISSKEDKYEAEIYEDDNLTSTGPMVQFTHLQRKKKKSGIIIIDDNNDEEFNLSYEEDLDNDAEELVNSVNEESGLDDFIEDNLIVDDDELSESDSEADDFQLGKFLGKLKKTRNGDNYIELPAHRKIKNHKQDNNKYKKKEKVLYTVSSDTDNLSMDNVIKYVNKKMYGEIGPEEIKEELDEPEFGFLEEDYVSFDVTQIKIDNIRVGATPENQQYYVQAPHLFGFDDYQWLTRDDFESFLIENGLPEHRINAFIRSATSNIVDPQAPDDQDLFDEEEIYISDSSEEEEDVDSSNDLKEYHLQFRNKSRKSKSRKKDVELFDEGIDGNDSPQSDTEFDEELLEGMEDLLTMHQSSKNSNFDPLDVNTKSIRARGKKKNFKLELNTEINPHFQKFLEEKYILRKKNQADKKQEREYARKNNAYMLTKYPYLLEMPEILEEFKDFKNDPIRETLRFPPMDFHVNMVLKAIAEAFGFSSRKIGKGKKEYFEARKPHKKKSREPDWNRIKKLATKRHVCFRMDVELSREEKRELKRIKGGNIEIERMRNKGRGNFSYKEGEIVGAVAKEIDESSIGRKLLEKMGWQAGDALGTENNKGIIEPIKVVVKTSKRGIM
jgi:hypothetical protein